MLVSHLCLLQANLLLNLVQVIIVFFLSFYLNHPIFGFWLIGYGAIDHRSSSLQYFSSFYSIKIVRVSLANGTSVIVNYAGNVHFFLH